ncbi:rhodanese-like domain-containing protein [Leptolyngbya sp. CCNP1308]|uniref:rhodanese-like domain-containing protein n=1 Tax=Leptolyngbya sp. CCNP1308 TaxID=3110255 RepID=UPI002B1F419E|nr:rhodanese-like domain-containing protein [Leptolyngbya sp. CCNP1308]MEA5452155.1 rhodanese-like domain-containing protein [Leptolyngbya sp. CCNP1308]
MSPIPNPGVPLRPLRALAWWAVDRWVQRAFPEVPTLTTQQLADWLSQGNAPSPILLDVRRDDEFAVSHLPEAHRAANLEAALALELDRDRPLVAYCSVGYRSARLVAQLQGLGYSEVYNLAGSIFQWANQGRSLVGQGQPQAQVHPYSPLWGRLLKPGLAAPLRKGTDG